MQHCSTCVYTVMQLSLALAIAAIMSVCYCRLGDMSREIMRSSKMFNNTFKLTALHLNVLYYTLLHCTALHIFPHTVMSFKCIKNCKQSGKIRCWKFSSGNLLNIFGLPEIFLVFSFKYQALSPFS